jgi:hypothetical protein
MIMDILKQFDKPKPPKPVVVKHEIIRHNPPKFLKNVEIPQPRPPAPTLLPEPMKRINPDKVVLNLPKLSRKLEVVQEEKKTTRVKQEPFSLVLPKFSQKIEVVPEPKTSTHIKHELFTLELPKFSQKIEIAPEPTPTKLVKHDKIILDFIPKSEHRLTLPLAYENKEEKKEKKREPFSLDLPKFSFLPFEKTESKKETKRETFTLDLPKYYHTLGVSDDDYNNELAVTPNILENIIIRENKPIPTIGKIQYNSPKRRDVAVLLVFFDYIGSARILINYLFMVEKLKLADIPVFTLELVLYGKKPKIKDAQHVYGSSYLFQKEHLIRLLERSIPRYYTKLACLDADVLFENPNWYDDLSVLLDSNHAVQCFDVSTWLDLTYTMVDRKSASCLVADKSKRFWENQKQALHPGFGWAFRRKFYRQVGFFDEAVIGSGDTIFAYGLLHYSVKENDIESRIYKEACINWMKKFKSRKYDYLKGELYHLYHGPRANRQYVSRYEAFKDVKNIKDVISTNEYGVCELTDPVLNNAMLEFFKTRDDDGL